MDPNIRLASPSEAPVLSSIATSAKQSNGYNDTFMDACRDELTVTFRDVSTEEYWVAETDDIKGFVCLIEGADREVGEIQSFFIAPACERGGIGKLLWQKVLERAKFRGIHTIFLDSDPAAVPFYEGLGFRVIGEVPSGSIIGRTIPRMKLKVA